MNASTNLRIRVSFNTYRPSGDLDGEPSDLTSVPDNEYRYNSRMEHQELFAGLIRLHILYHAAKGDLYGQWMIEELARHGYKVSPGTLYPMLHALERKGYLRSTQKRSGRTYRRVYRVTPLGRRALTSATSKVRELFHEIIEIEK
jgi:PadR family transcriptional regulator PadR